MSRAFTIFEVLVVLMILGLLSAVTLTLITQLRGTMERLFPAAEHYVKTEVRTHVLSKTLAAMVPARNPEQHFKGDRTSIEGLTTYFPGEAWPHEQFTRLEIRNENGFTEVSIRKLSGNDDRSDGKDRVDVLRLPCSDGRFRYLTAQINWTSGWTQQQRFPHLPLAIYFSCNDSHSGIHIISAIAREGDAILRDRPLL